LKILIFVIAAWMTPWGVSAESLTGEAGKGPITPIETKMNMGFLGVLGGSMDYRIKGRKITRYEDFKSLIYPLRDEESSRMIRESETDHFTAMVLYAAGLGLGVDLALVYNPNPLFKVDWLDRIITGMIGVQIFAGLGGLFDANAEGHKYNAVQRYNQLISQPKESLLDLRPQWSADKREFTLALTRSF